MSKLCAALVAEGFNLAEKDALEVFGREGDWHTVDYAHLVRSLEVWEIDDLYNEALARNLPGARIRNVDSIIHASDPANCDRFDFIVIDNPQALFGAGGAYCEHFDVIEPAAANMLRPDGVLVFNVNVEPYDYADHEEWRKRRETFYGRTDTDNMSLASLDAFYTRFLEDCGKSVAYSAQFPRNDFLYYFVYRLRATG